MMDAITERILEAKKKQLKTWPRNVNYASDAGHPCERYLYFSRAAWDEKAPLDLGLKFIFDRGNHIESYMLSSLAGAGYEIVEQQRPYEWKDLELRGRIDLKLRINGALIPGEIKSVSPFYFHKFNSVEDMLNADRYYYRSWPAQLLLYELMDNSPIGLFFLVNALTWRPKTIEVPLNSYLDYTEGILKKLERVNRHIKSGQGPSSFPGDMSICPDCGFFHVCNPDLTMGQEVDILNDPELEHLLQERERNQEARKIYNDADKIVKQRLKGIEKALIGDFLIEGQEQVRNVKAQPAREDRFWKLTITRMAKTSLC